MRGVKVFSGRSHPDLTTAICERLGMSPGECDLGNFANGETSVQINTSIRNEDVFIVQSGSRNINDSVMEMLILIAACKGGSAKSITAVMPYFPYARSSKKKSHRGPITAKMLANLMAVAGLNHLITIDLHASQMQGFFHHGVDNLHCEPLIARWIKGNIPTWRESVVVSKNVGGSKRVTSLADHLKLNFALCSTNRTRIPQYHTNMLDSVVFFSAIEPRSSQSPLSIPAQRFKPGSDKEEEQLAPDQIPVASHSTAPQQQKRAANAKDRPSRPKNVTIASSPLIQTTRQASESPAPSEISPPPSPHRLLRVETAPSARRPSEYEAAEGFHDEKARDVVVARLVQGHIVNDDDPSPALSGMSHSGLLQHDRTSEDSIEAPAMDHMMSSFISTASSYSPGHALGGTFDAAASSEDEEEDLRNPDLEHTVTLVGNVRDKVAIIHDDIMDRAGSWIAAAETCVKRGGAKEVYCIGIHALLGDNALEEMEACECIDRIVVTNTFPISPLSLRTCRKLVVIDVSNLLAEAIRRNHHGGKNRVKSPLRRELTECRIRLSTIYSRLSLVSMTPYTQRDHRSQRGCGASPRPYRFESYGQSFDQHRTSYGSTDGSGRPGHEVCDSPTRSSGMC